MDITPQDTTTQPISDDQELAKALAGVLPDEPEEPAAESSLENDMQFEEIPAAPASAPVAAPEPIVTPPSTDESAEPDDVTAAVVDIPAVPSIDTPVATDTKSVNTDLENIKNQALDELRPLIDHVDIPAEEKFDTYLMLLRSTDDSTLIAPAHTAAQAIADEKRKAEALLDIIKEIDYLSRKDKDDTPAI